MRAAVWFAVGITVGAVARNGGDLLGQLLYSRSISH